MPLLAAIGCLLTLVPLAFAAYKIGPTSHLDNSLLLQIARPRPGTVNGVAEVIRLLGELPVVVLLVAGLVLFGRHLGRRREAFAAAALVVGAGVTTQLLKFVFAYPRFADTWWTQPHDLAFPSGHATAAAALSIALVLVVPPVHRLTAAAVGILATAGVCISVIILGWHYPSDVLGGLLVASAWGFAAVAWLRFQVYRDGAVSSDGRQRSRHLAVSTD
jgi:membrane-associated phospholipid phosphatase